MVKEAGESADKNPTTVAAQDSQSGAAPQRAESAWEKLLPTMAPIVITFLGAVTYGVLRGSYSRFYSRYGLTPEDAGLSQLQVLAGTTRIFRLGAFSGLTPLLFVTLIVLFIILWIEFVWIVTQMKWARRFFSTRYRQVAIPLFVALGAMLLVLLLAFSYTLPQDRSTAWRRIDDGRGVHPQDLAFLSLQADPSYVIWIETKDSPAPKDFPAPDHTVIYLGHADSTVAFFDPTSESTWRVPEDNVLVRLKALQIDRGGSASI